MASKGAGITGAHKCKGGGGAQTVPLKSNHNEGSEIAIKISQYDCRKSNLLHFIYVRQDGVGEVGRADEASKRGTHMCDCRVKSAFKFSMDVVDGQLVHEGTRPIHFCHCCERLVSSSDLNGGAATLADGKACCRQCQSQRTPSRFSGVFTRHLSGVRRRFAIPRHRRSLALGLSFGG